MRRPTSFALAIVLMFIVSVRGQSQQQPCQPPPLIASREPNIFTEDQEMDLGDAVAEHFQRYFHATDDQNITRYLTRIGERLSKHLPPTRLRFRFFLVDQADANAFVLPGGRIYVSRKLIAQAQSEDELAGVIAHEMGHMIARHNAIEMTQRLHDVLGVTSVTDRKDIFDKYNQLVENTARKPRVQAKGGAHDDKEQDAADQIGLFAMASAGYDPRAQETFFDRIADTKGKTGNFFSDLFGTTKPEMKRLREMLSNLKSLPPACVEGRAAGITDDFQKWQAAVVAYSEVARPEALHGVRTKTELNPPLRGEINHIRFSPDGRYVLAQDDSGINILLREPLLAPLFRINAPGARPAHFTPDSRDVVVWNPNLRIEVWNIAEQKLKSANELFVHKSCVQTMLSPKGDVIACLDDDMNLDLFDVVSGAQIFQRKSFHILDPMTAFLLNLLNLEREAKLIHMGFSPDGRYFAAGTVNSFQNVVGWRGTEDSGLVFDLSSHNTVPLRGQVKYFLAGGFAFMGSDRLAGIDAMDPKKSGLISFPAGEPLAELPLVSGMDVKAAAHGNYMIVGPNRQGALGIVDLSSKAVIGSSKQSTLDVYDGIIAAERLNGEIGLFELDKTALKAKAELPLSPLADLHVVELSPDFKWLAVSERTRGAVWDLTTSERILHVRGFNGAYFAGGTNTSNGTSGMAATSTAASTPGSAVSGNDDGLYVDFPAYEKDKRMIARLDLGKRTADFVKEMDNKLAFQYGPYVLVKDYGTWKGDRFTGGSIEMRSIRDQKTLWSRQLQEPPRIWIDTEENTMVMLQPATSKAAKVEIENDKGLSKQLAEVKDQKGVYLIEVLDPGTGRSLGKLLIDTGKGSFHISGAFAAGDRLVVSDSENRVLLYSISTHSQTGTVFGGRPTLSLAAGLLTVENEPGHLSFYDLASMETRDQLVFSSPLSMTRFSRDGKSLFVLTSNQTAYVLDVASIGRDASAKR